MRPELPELRDELLRRAQRDQDVRHALGDRPVSQQWVRLKAVDADNAPWLADILLDHGWPGIRLVGADGAHAAWLLLQHAPLEFQQRYLPLLRQAVEQGEATAVQLAYLDDRVRIREQRPQRHGTQWRVEHGGHRLLPLDDPAGVNERRTLLGLPPLDETDIAHALPSDFTSDS